MSLAETQELMRTMQELMTLLKGVEEKTEKLNADYPRTKETLATFRQLERLALRWLVLAKQMGLPDDATRAIDTIAKLIVVLRMAQMSLNMMMMSNPVTALIGVAGIIGTAATLPSMLEGY